MMERESRVITPSAEAKRNLRRVHNKRNHAEIFPRICEYPKLEALREVWCLIQSQWGGQHPQSTRIRNN